MMERSLSIIKNILIVTFSLLIFYIIGHNREILIPFLMALFLAIVMEPTIAWLTSKKVPSGLSMILVWGITLTALFFIGKLIVDTGKDLVAEKDILILQINTKFENLFEWLLSLELVDVEVNDFTHLLGALLSTDWVIASSGKLAGALGNLTAVFFLTAIYLAGLLGGIVNYKKVIPYLEGEKGTGSMLSGFETVKNSISEYMRVKFMMSFGTGFLLGLACYIAGVEFALFWGFMAFVLNFIPSIWFAYRLFVPHFDEFPGF